MKKDMFTTRKQSGKVTVTIVGNGIPTVTKWKDNGFYQVAGHGDYVQEKN